MAVGKFITTITTPCSGVQGLRAVHYVHHGIGPRTR